MMAFSNYAITVFLLFATLTILVSGRPRLARQENRKRGKKLPVSYQKNKIAYMQRSPYNVQLWTIFKEENDPQQSFKISLVENTCPMQLTVDIT